MSRTRHAARALLAVFFAAFSLVACNISDEGGGIEVECLEDDECPDGRCSNGICIDLSPNNDAGNSNNVTSMDAGPADMGTDMGGDTGPVDMGTDMGMLECPDGLIDFNLNADDGCETPTFPGWDDAACQACAGIPNAVGGCGDGGTCAIAACAPGFYDRDGELENGCETTCAPGECWDIIASEHREIVFVSGPDFWFTATPTGLIGRELAADEWTYHSLEGPRDFVASPLRDLHVVDEVIYGNIRDKLVRSVDHGRTFGIHPDAPSGSLIDVNEGADGRYYLLVADQECEPTTCTDNSPCGAEPQCSTAAGVCGTTACADDRDCAEGRSCSTDGVCIAQPSGCRFCSFNDSCSNPTFQVYVTNDFNVFMPIGPTLPAGASAAVIHGSIDGFPIVTQVNGNGGDDLRINPTTNQWEQIDSRNCPIEFMVFLQSGDGVAIGDRCSFEYDGQEGKLNNRENIDGDPNDVLLHQDVIYVGGAGFISVSTSFGSNYADRQVQGDVIHLYADTDDSIVAVGSHGERWRSVDRGQSWVQEVEARQPYPRQVESGTPLSLMGLGQQGGIIAPSSAGPREPWIQLATQNVQRIKQSQGAAFGFSTNPPLFSGTDWQSLNPMSVTTQLVDTSQWPACSGLPCRIAAVVDVRDGTYDGSNMFVVAYVRLQFRPSSLIGWQTVGGNVPAILRSANGVSWDGVQYLGTSQPDHIAAASFGLVTDRGYSADGIQWFSSGTPTCGNGPFFRGPNGDIVGFGDANVCTTADGETWDLLTEDFWPTNVPVTAQSVNIRGGAFFVTVDAGGTTAVNASDDGMSWRTVGPRWPGNTDITFGDNAAAAAHPGFFAISN